MNIFSLNSLTLSTITTPFVSAFIGWVTTYLAIKMLFRPKKAYNILGITIQGLMPRRHKELAKNIAEVVERELISHKDVQNFLQDDSVIKDLSFFVEKQIDVFLKEKLASNPMLSMFLTGDLLASIKNSLITQFQNTLPDLLEVMISKIEKNLNFQDVIEKKVEDFDLGKLEEIIYRIAAKELRGIEYLCGVLGFVIGIGQVMLF